MAEEKQNPTSSNVRQQLITTIKDLRVLLNKETENFKAKSKENLSKGNQQAEETRNNLKKTINASLADFSQYNEDQLISLKESLEGQLESLRGYTDQLVTEEESRLVNSLEASLTNVKDVSVAQKDGLQKLYTKVNEIANKSTSKSIEIIKNRDTRLKDELAEELEMKRDDLAVNIINLQDEFRDEIHNKIENVYMGVSNTKRIIDGIIRDTLSRLEENLKRLTEGIDTNFTKEVGEAQDLIHTYEGKLMNAITASQETYQTVLESILDRHALVTSQSLDKLKQELDTFKSEIMGEITSLNSEQSQLFNNATQQLESQIERSRADVIDSHGTLKDELEKLLTANREGIEEAIGSLRSAASSNTSNLEKRVSESINSTNQQFSTSVNSIKSNIDEHTDNMKALIKQSTNRAEKTVNENR